MQFIVVRRPASSGRRQLIDSDARSCTPQSFMLTGGTWASAPVTLCIQYAYNNDPVSSCECSAAQRRTVRYIACRTVTPVLRVTARHCASSAEMLLIVAAYGAQEPSAV